MYWVRIPASLNFNSPKFLVFIVEIKKSDVLNKNEALLFNLNYLSPFTNCKAVKQNYIHKFKITQLENYNNFNKNF